MKERIMPILYLVIPCYNEQEVLPITKGMFLKKIRNLILDKKQGYQGMAIVRFQEPWYWRVSEIISLCTIVYMISLLIKNRKQFETG